MPSIFHFLIRPIAFFMPVKSKNAANPKATPTINSRNKEGQLSKTWCKKSKLWTKIPPATSSKAIVPITPKLLMTKGNALTKRCPKKSDMLLSLSLKLISQRLINIQDLNKIHVDSTSMQAISLVNTMFLRRVKYTKAEKVAANFRIIWLISVFSV